MMIDAIDRELWRSPTLAHAGGRMTDSDERKK
jgi:hypothetical protein